MTDKKQDDDYDIPPGIMLPQEDYVNYPNWKKGIICGIPCGVLSGFILALTPLGKEPGGRIWFAILGFIMAFLMVGSIVTFRPPKN